MATTSANTALEAITDVDCPICFNQYDEEIRKPKFLPCAHTICLECSQVSPIRQRDTITCPICRYCSSIDNGAGSEYVLTTNPYALDVLRCLRETASVTSLATQETRERLEEDVLFRIALAISRREMEEKRALNDAMLNQSSLRQHHQIVGQSRDRPTLRSFMRRNSQEDRVTTADAVPPTTVPNSNFQDTSCEEWYHVILFCSALLYYAFLLFCQLLAFSFHHPTFLIGTVFVIVNRTADPSYDDFYFYIIFGFSVLSSDACFLVYQLFVFFFYHLELLLVIAFMFVHLFTNVGRNFNETRNHLNVPLSNTI